MTKPEIPVFVLGGAGLVAVCVLVGLGHAVPAPLWALVTALFGGGLGITIPRSATDASVAQALSAVAAAAVKDFSPAAASTSASSSAPSSSAASITTLPGTTTVGGSAQ